MFLACPWSPLKCFYSLHLALAEPIPGLRQSGRVREDKVSKVRREDVQNMPGAGKHGWHNYFIAFKRGNDDKRSGHGIIMSGYQSYNCCYQALR